MLSINALRLRITKLRLGGVYPLQEATTGKVGVKASHSAASVQTILHQETSEWHTSPDKRM